MNNQRRHHLQQNYSIRHSLITWWTHLLYRTHHPALLPSNTKPHQSTPIGKKGMTKTSPVSHLIHKVIDLDGLLHASTLNRPTMASGRSISLPFTVRRQGKRGNTYTLHRPSSSSNHTHTTIAKQKIP